MPSIKKETLLAIAGLSDDDKANLSALFDETLATEKTLAELRAKVPTDSQTVVDSVEFKKLQETAARNEELKKELAEKMEALSLAKSGVDPLEAFKPIIGFLY